MTTDSYEKLFAEIPFPGLIISLDKWEIIAVNNKFSDFSGYSLDKLIGREIRSLLPGLRIEQFQTDQKIQKNTQNLQPVMLGRQNLEITLPNQKRILSLAKTYKLPNDSSHLLIIIEANHTKQETSQISPSSEFWHSMEMLVGAIGEQDLPTALDRIIKISHDITSAEQIIFYKMAEDQPVLRKWASFSNLTTFPDQINAQELVSLSTPQIWKPGRRTLNLVHRAARHNNFGYVATAPIGEPHAIIGLIILAGVSSPAGNLINFVQYISMMLGMVLERHTWRNNLERDIESFQARINSANTIEERISDGLILLNNDLEIKRLNIAAETILGYNHQEVIGQHVNKILIGAEQLNQALRNAQNASSTFRLGENIRLYRRNGESFQAIVRIFPVIQGKQVAEILVLISDLSEQEFIKQQAQQLEQRAFLGEVTATFAHEIRNPVHNISTGLQLMALKLSKDDPIQQDIDCMIQDCDRLAELIKSVLAFSKPVEYEMENVDIGQMLRNLLERLHARISRSKVEYALQISPDCPLVIGNLHALEQVINNLVGNSLQAMETNGGRMVIKAHPLSTPEGRQFVEISIADTGHGIPKENQERIFQPFFTTKKKGTGLGLAVSKRILTAHKGTIRLTSFPGGTIFHIQLPASKTE